MEELQSEVQLLNSRIDEMAKKIIELNQEKDELEKVSEALNRTLLSWTSTE